MTAALPAEAVIVLVGAPASGKTTLRRRLLEETTLRRRLLEEATSPLDVLSPDDEREALRAWDVTAGRKVRDLQEYSLPAIRRCEERADQLIAAGRGYLADATHLRRRERVAHVRRAHEAALPAVALLLPDLPIPVLAARNSPRSADQRVPDDVLARHAHRRSLLSAALLRDEGFDEVHEVTAESSSLPF